MIGTTVSHYRVLEKLGQGGMGVVYLAEDSTLGRKVALKFCRTGGDPHTRNRLLEEAKAASSLIHPNIAQIYEFGTTDDGEPFIAMEYVPGCTLAEKIDGRPIDTDEALRIVSDVALALAAAHAAGIVHRDIKPSNIRFTDAGEVKVLDFGLAHTFRSRTAITEEFDSTRTMEGRIKGTPAYMAPEQARGAEVDLRADLFSLGAVMYECLTGRSPFAGPTQTDSLAKVIETDPPRPFTVNPRLDPGLDRITMKLLAKDRLERYASVQEFLGALGALRSRLAFLRRRPFRVAASALACVAVVAAAYGIWRLLNAPHKPPPEAARWYNEGLVAMIDGTFFKATKMLDRAVQIDPNYTMAHALLAEAWNELDSSDRAQEELLRAMPPGRAPKLSAADEIHLRAIHATVTRNFPEAARQFEMLPSRRRGLERVGALLELGRAYEKIDRQGDALQAYIEATRADPDSAAAFLQLAWYYARRAPDKAATPLERAESLYRTVSNQEGLTECVYVRARLAPDAKTSIEFLRRALAQAELSENAQQTIKVELLLAERLYRSGNPADAGQCAQKAIDSAETNGLQEMMARGLMNFGNLLFLNGDPKARSYAEKGLELARRRRSKRFEAQALMLLGNIDIATGRATQGIDEAEQALAYYRNNGYREETSRGLVMLGNAYAQRGDLDSATKSFSDAITNIGREHRSPELGYAQEGLASVMLAQDRFPEALGQIERAKETYEAAGLAQGKFSATASLGTLYALLGRDREAQAELVKARPLAAELKSQWSRAALGEAEATVDLYGRRYDSSRRIAMRVLSSPQSDDPPQTCRVRINLALALARSGATRDAIAQSSRAAQEAAALDQPELICQAAMASAEAFAAAGRAAHAESAVQSARAFVEKAGKIDAAWRGWAILARIRSGDGRAEAIRNAQAELTRLRSRWPASEVESYLRRPDVVSLLKAVQSR